MKKITFNLSKLLLIIVLGLFLITIISTSNNIHAIWDNKSLVNVTNDDGSVVYYNKSKEPVMRATDYNFPLQSLRATWVSQFVGSIPLYSTEAAWKSDVKKMLDRVEEYGLNCIVYHVRTHNNACYKTDLAPRATFMEKADFDTFDPIEYLITECHKRAIEFHAWLNPYRISDSYCAEGYPKENPASDPANILSVGSNKILNPALPNVQDFLVKVCVELAENYDIDAIHFDDYFYIDGVDDTETRKKLNTNNLSVGDFRRQAVDQFIEKLSKSIKDYNKKNHKAVQIGISPPGGYRNQSSSSYPSKPTYNTDGSLKSPLGSNTSCFTSYDDYLYADTLKWVNNEWIDYMMPQMYWSISHTGASYADLTEWWSWAVRNRKVNLYTGIGYYMAAGSGSSASYWQKNINEIRDQILLAQTRPEIGGVCFYSYNYLNNTNKTIKTGMDLLKNNYYKTKIPCDVKKSYAGVYEKKDVTNVKLVSNEITWNKVDDVRGYIIFEVKPNEELNLKNDLQVAYYGTDTKFTIKDLNNTYYISTVNQANEISTPKIISKFEKSPTKLIEYINNVPARTDKNYKVYIESIYDIYNSLTNAEKELVTNKDKLLNIIELDNAYIDLSDKINNYVNIKLYSDETQNLINKKIKESLESASSATSVQEINNIYEAYKKEIDTYKLAEEELKELKDAVIKTIEEYYNKLEKNLYTLENQNKILDITFDIKNAITKSNSSNNINQLSKSYINQISLIPSFEKEYNEKLLEIHHAIDEVIDNVNKEAYYIKYQSQIQDLYYQYIDKIIKEKVSDVLNDTSLKEKYAFDFDDDIYNYSLLYDEYNKKLKALDYYDGKKEGLEELKQNTINSFDKANTIEEINEIFEQFKTNYSNLKSSKKEPIDTGCNSLNIIYLFITTSLLFIILKKHH